MRGLNAVKSKKGVVNKNPPQRKETIPPHERETEHSRDECEFLATSVRQFEERVRFWSEVTGTLPKQYWFHTMRLTEPRTGKTNKSNQSAISCTHHILAIFFFLSEILNYITLSKFSPSYIRVDPYKFAYLCIWMCCPQHMCFGGKMGSLIHGQDCLWETEEWIGA